MHFVQKWSQRTQVQCITGLANQIQRSQPGIIVCNFHPQNVAEVRDVHKAVIEIGRRPGWAALGAESYAAWLATLTQVRIHYASNKVLLRSGERVDDLAFTWPSAGIKTKKIVPGWDGEIELFGAR
jgi:hypothetical protein